MSERLEVIKMKSDIKFQEKDMLISYLLLIFLGYLGVHRFYLGKPKTGLLMLFITCFGWLTLGLAYIVLFIWILIDYYYVYIYVSEHNEKIKIQKLQYVEENLKSKEENLSENI